MLARPFRYPVRWLAFLAGGIPAVLVFPGPSLSYLAWFALVPGMVLFTRAAEGTSAGSDIHATKAYREHLARVLVRRALEEAATRP